MNSGVARQAVIGSVLVLLFLAAAFPAGAAISGVTGTQFNLVAREGYVVMEGEKATVAVPLFAAWIRRTQGAPQTPR